jgi:hypothetical protein
LRAVVFVILVLFVAFPIFNVIPSFGAVATICFSEYTGPNEITIVFGESCDPTIVDWVIGDFTNIVHNNTSGNPTVLSITETSPSSIVTLNFSGSAVNADEVGRIDIAAINDTGSGNTFAGSTNQTLLDGINPSLVDPEIFFADSFTVFFDEEIVDSSVTLGDFIVSGIASSPSVISANFSPFAATFGLDGSITTNDTSITLSYNKTSGSIDDLSVNMLQNFTDFSVRNAAPVFEFANTINSTAILVAFDTDIVNATVTSSDFTVAGNTVTGVSFSSPGAYNLTLGTPIATDATPLVTLVDSITDVIGFIQTSDSIVPFDFIPPTMDSLVTVSTTTINVIFSEALDDSTISAGDFTVTNTEEESFTVTSASQTSSGVVTLTLDESASGTVTVTLVGSVSDAVFSSNILSSGSLDVTIITEGGGGSIDVTDPGGTGTFSYPETENETTEAVSLGVTLPAGTIGTITVATLTKNNLESGTVLATAADITGPCTGFCTIQFIVPNSLLDAAGLTPETTSIYHDINENGLLEADEAILTNIDTTTIPDSTIFTANAAFTSSFGVGGKSGSAGASSTGVSGSANDRCDSSAFGRGKSIRVYEISYEICEVEKLDVIAKSECGPAYLTVLYEGGITRGGLSIDQPYLDENKVLLTAPLNKDYNKFRVLVENDKSYYDKIIIPQKLHGLIPESECQKTITISHETGYLSNQTSSFAPSKSKSNAQSEPQPDVPSKKTMSPRKTISTNVLPPLNNLLFESENNDAQITTLEYDPEPCVDTWDESCFLAEPEPCVDTWDDSCLVVDPEPCVDTWDDSCLVVDPEPCVDTWDDSCLLIDPEPCVDTWNGSCLDSKYNKDDDLNLLNWLFNLDPST